MSTRPASFLDYAKTYGLLVLPHHALTRVVYWLTRRESRFTTNVIKKFAAVFNVDMNDAIDPNLNNYKTFNAFFTRALKGDARPIAEGDNEIASPADGRVSAMGDIHDARVFQAKGRDYSLLTLLGGDGDATERLGNGRFTTIYLSPKDYHRLHMPLGGRLIKQTHVPGRLFSVGPHTVKTLPNLFTRNERVIAQFETEHGLMALVLVGAMNVAAIETVWDGLVTPPQKAAMSSKGYADQNIQLKKGEEMGRFNMGSTIIVLLENPAAWRVDMQAGDAVRMGQFLGQIQ
ncbi:MAG: phosphatidylserine decarboxylase [Granulosicoccus sp.]